MSKWGLIVAAAFLTLGLGLAAAGSASAAEHPTSGKGLTAAQPASASTSTNLDRLDELRNAVIIDIVFDDATSADNNTFVVNQGERLDELRAYKVTSSDGIGRPNTASAFSVGTNEPAVIAAVDTISGYNPTAGVIVASTSARINVTGYNPVYVEKDRPSISSAIRPAVINPVQAASISKVAIHADTVGENTTEGPKTGNAGLLGTDGGSGGLWLLLGFAAVAGAAVAGRQLYGRREG